MQGNVIEEYLVSISADIDRQSFTSVKSLVSDLKGQLSKLVNAAGPVPTTLMAVVTALGAVTKATESLITQVAEADMQYRKLGRQMWITKDSAKALKIAMDTMGASAEDIAWIPELREQFKRLREEMDQFRTPADADEQLKYVRSIQYDLQALFVRLKMFKEWVVYHLIRYLKPFLKKIKEGIKALSDALGGSMKEKAKTLAAILSRLVSLFLSVVQFITMAVKGLAKILDRIPDNIKKWGSVFAVIGTLIMSGPFGKVLAAVSAAILLLEDFIYYVNGWNSSSTLAPVWDGLMKMGKTIGGPVLSRVAAVLREISNILKEIFTGMKINEMLAETKSTVNALLTGANDILEVVIKLIQKLDQLFGLFRTQSGPVTSFWSRVGSLISEAAKTQLRFLKLIGRLMSAVAKAMNGEWGAAGMTAMNAMKDFASEQLQGFKYALTGDRDPGNATLSFIQNAHRDGEQWMSPEVADPSVQCAAFVSHAYESVGIQGLHHVNVDGLSGQFGGAFHPIGDGYEPQPGDMIKWAGHVGIYAGNGEYIARNSQGGVHRGSMAEGNEWFGPVQGYGSIREYSGYQPGLGNSYGATAPAFSPGSVAEQWAKQSPNAANLYGYGNGGGSGEYTFNLGAVNVYVDQPNASADDIASLVPQKIDQWQQSVIHSRAMRGVVK